MDVISKLMKMIKKSKQNTGKNQTSSNTISLRPNNSATDKNKEVVTTSSEKHMEKEKTYVIRDSQNNNDVATDTTLENKSSNKENKVCTEIINRSKEIEANAKADETNLNGLKEFDDILAELRGDHTANGSDDISLEDIDDIINNTQDDTYNFQEIKCTNLSTLNNSNICLCEDSLLDRNEARVEDGSDIISLSSEEFDNSDKVIIAKRANLKHNITKIGKHSINNTSAKMCNGLTNKNITELPVVNDIIDLTKEEEKEVPSNLKETTIEDDNINTNKRNKLTIRTIQCQCSAINTILTIDQQITLDSLNKEPKKENDKQSIVKNQSDNREDLSPIEKDMTQNASKDTDQSKENNNSYKIQDVQTINKNIAKNVAVSKEKSKKESDKTVHSKYIQDVRTTEIELDHRDTVRPMEIAQNEDTCIENNNQKFIENNHTDEAQNVATVEKEFAQNIHLISAKETAENASKESNKNIHFNNITDEGIIKIVFNQDLNTMCPMVTAQNGDVKKENVNKLVTENHCHDIQNHSFEIETVQNRDMLESQNVNQDARTIEIEIPPNASKSSKEQVQNEDDIIQNISDDDCGYQSSDFEFITEEEACMDGFIINFDPEIYLNDLRDRDSDIFKMSSIESNSNSINSDIQFNLYGPGPSRNVNIVGNAITENNSDLVVTVGRDIVNPYVNPRNLEIQFDPYGPGPSRNINIVGNAITKNDSDLVDKHFVNSNFNQRNLEIQFDPHGPGPSRDINIVENAITKNDSDFVGKNFGNPNLYPINLEIQFDPHGPGPSRNVNIVGNAITENYSDIVGRDFFNTNFNPRNLEIQFDPHGPGPSRNVAVVENDEEDYRIPEEQEFINMFQNHNLGISLHEIHILENKSLITRAATLAPYKNLGFDVNLIAAHAADSSEDEFREEAEENLKIIFQNYPAENNRRKRRKR